MLTIAEISNRRNLGGNGKANKHIGNAVASGIRCIRICRELTAELQVPTRLADLQKIELIPPKLRPGFDQVLSMHETEGVVDLNVLTRHLRRGEQRLA